MFDFLPSGADHRSLFAQRYDRLLAAARHIVGGGADQARDLVHDAFVQFALGAPDLSAIADLDAYLYGMLRNMHLSRVRRAQRLQTLSIADYDSIRVGLRGLEPGQRSRHRDDLVRLAQHAAARKDVTPTASVLILRFFREFGPQLVARIAHAPDNVVAQRLRRGRLEARAALEHTNRIVFPGAESRLASVEPLDPHASVDDWLAALLAIIDNSCRGRCLGHRELDELYAFQTPVPTAALAHLASCPACLSRAVRRLSTSDPPIDGAPEPLVGRPSPFERVRRARRHDDGTSWLQAVRDHRPCELRVFANGFLVGAHAVTSKLCELTVRAHLDEPLRFVEIFSEQGVQLLFVDVHPVLAGAGRQDGAIDFRDGRSLRASIDFSDVWPLVQVRYTDPRFEPAADAEPGPAIGDRQGERQLSSRRVLSWPMVWRGAFAFGVLLWLLLGGGRALAAGAARAWHWLLSHARVADAGGPPIPSRSIPAVIGALPGRVAAGIVAVETARPRPSEPSLVALELRAFERLSDAGLLRAGQVRIERRIDRVRVNAVTESRVEAERMLAALQPLAAKGLLDVAVDDVSTPSAATARAGRRAPMAIRRFDVQRAQRIPAYDRLADSFRAEGTPEAAIDAVVRDHADDVVRRSRAALLDALAARRIAEHFDPAALAMLPPSDVASWRRLIQTYASMFVRESALLRASIAPLIGAPPLDDAEDPAALLEPPADVSSSDGIRRLTARLVERALACDTALRSLLTIPLDGSPAVDEDTYRRLGRAAADAERLARAMER